ncbi:hypothetical protein NM208_g15182 [Fusarium decemcellulare]|uniref:Uncharacterized protein n=1 Tax=Fusarium decemcellulare TaxID=57161 RepID=A0ACC1RGB6_9HYPO|nr:hypothetical protein NM208_g15182 [Fusarium decemcellulare]
MGSNGNSNGNSHPVSAATKLRRLLESDEIVVAPGVYDGFSARIAHEVGFECIYMELALAPPSWASPILASHRSTTCASTPR